jgi:hypothetical protein
MLLEMSVEDAFFLHAVRSFFLTATYWQPPPPCHRGAFSQLKEVITIRTEFNLGPDRHVAVTLLCYFMKKENQSLSIILQETKRKHSFFKRNETRVSVTLLFVTI